MLESRGSSRSRSPAAVRSGWPRRSPASSAGPSRSRVGAAMTLAVHAPAGAPDARRRSPRTTTGRASRPPGSPCRSPRGVPASRCDGMRSGPWRCSASDRRPSSSASRRRGSPVSSPSSWPATRPRPGDRDGSPRALPAEGPPWVVIVARQATGATADRRPSSAGSSSNAADAASREALRRDLRALPRRAGWRSAATSRASSSGVVAAPPDDPEAMELAGRIAAFLGRLVAVSRPFSEARRPIRGRGRRAGDAGGGRAACRSRPAVARADRLPGLPAAGQPAQPARRRAPGPGAAGAAPARPCRTSAASGWRRSGRSSSSRGIAEAADALGVHRNTVAYRIRAIEAATGWRLADPELRFPLALALRLVQDA